MIKIRLSRNTDPPGLVAVWNEVVTGRGGYPVRTPGLFERWILSKCYFRNDDVVVALDEESNTIIGFALGSFGPDEEFSKQSTSHGVICAIVVKPEYRKRGVGRQLLEGMEESLRQRGATTITVGSQWPNNPYLFGLHGGSNSPGILESEADAKPFLNKLGYAASNEVVMIYQKKLDTALNIVDTRFGHLRRRYDAQVLRAASVSSWWQECVWGLLEPVEIRMIDKLTNLPAARGVVWELEGFSWRWGYPSAGILDVQVRPDLRRQGLGKLLLTHLLRFLQDQFFAAAELQVPTSNEHGIALVKSLGFEEVDRGLTFVKQQPLPATSTPNESQSN